MAHVSARVTRGNALAVLLEAVPGAAVVQVAALEAAIALGQSADRVQHVPMLVTLVEPHTVASGTQSTMPASAKAKAENAPAIPLEAAADPVAVRGVGAARRLAPRATLSQRQSLTTSATPSHRQPVAASATLSQRQPVAAPTLLSQLAARIASRQLTTTPPTTAHHLLEIRTHDLQRQQALHQAGWRLPLERL